MQRLGSGSFGDVCYSAKQNVVVKRYRCDKLTTDIVREIGLMRMCDHKNIVSIYGVRRGEILLPYGGISLRKFMTCGDLAESTWLSIAQQMADGLQYLHNVGVAHRDLKPENILVERITAEDNAVRICDFGVSVRRGCRSRPQHNIYKYAAPELEDDVIDPRSGSLNRSGGSIGLSGSGIFTNYFAVDVYAACCILYELAGCYRDFILQLRFAAYAELADCFLPAQDRINIAQVCRILKRQITNTSYTPWRYLRPHCKISPLREREFHYASERCGGQMLSLTMNLYDETMYGAQIGDYVQPAVSSRSMSHEALLAAMNIAAKYLGEEVEIEENDRVLAMEWKMLGVVHIDQVL
jgi:serine/threonine protein kinase